MPGAKIEELGSGGITLPSYQPYLLIPYLLPYLLILVAVTPRNSPPAAAIGYPYLCSLPARTAGANQGRTPGGATDRANFGRPPSAATVRVHPRCSLTFGVLHISKSPRVATGDDTKLTPKVAGANGVPRLPSRFNCAEGVNLGVHPEFLEAPGQGTPAVQLTAYPIYRKHL
jgi:hypothetical protein